MSGPVQHALLSASSSGRWLNCTASPHYEQQFPETEAPVFAAEGTLAHSICEITAALRFGTISQRTFNTRLKKFRENELFADEMIRTAEFYADYLAEKAATFPSEPYAVQETRVVLSTYVPESFGTCDSVLIGSGRLAITDYKHGKGVQVSAENNSQMRLYALGALEKYELLYPNIKRVSMAIVQPRITEDVSEEEISVEELRAWGESIKAAAREAFDGPGVFKAGSWCRFCKGKAVCRARAENYTALEDFKDALIEGQTTYYDAVEAEARKIPVLTDEDVADLLIRGEGLVSWYNDLKEYAQTAILEGKTLPGWKVVEGRSIRAFSDADGAFDAITKAGYEEALLYERKPKTLAELEKMIGKKRFAEIAGEFIRRPPGKPALVPESDKREPYIPAAADFKEVIG